nr:putative capsid [Marmot picobirnavirus]
MSNKKQNRSNTNGGNNTSYRGKSQQGKPRQQRKQQNQGGKSKPNNSADATSQQIMEDAKSGKFNDINDFLRNPMLLKSAASVPIFPILGTNIGGAKPAPGVMAFGWIPNFGNYQTAAPRATGVTGATLNLTPPPVALNQASDSTYSFLVHANSRNYNYNAPDLFLLILAGSQVFSIIEAMKRAYGLAKRYIETDLYTPDTWLKAMGFDPISLRHNLSQAWFDINNLIMQTRQIWVPSVFPIVTRWMDMNSNIYKDADGDYAQTYVYVQAKYFKYNEVDVNTGGSLEVARLTPSGAEAEEDFNPGPKQYVWSDWVKVAQDMISALINSEDRGIIYGDLLNAYTAERIIAISEIDANYVIDRKYSPEISMQVENTVICSEYAVPNRLYQYENALYPGFAAANTQSFRNLPNRVFLNFHTTSDPTPEMIALATRFAASYYQACSVPTKNTSGAGLIELPAWVPLSSGTEVVVSMSIYTGPSGSATSGEVDYVVTNRSSATDLGDMLAWLRSMAFDWHPFTIDASTTSLTAPTQSQANNNAWSGHEVQEYYGDFDKYGRIDWEVLRKINDTCEFSLFGVPQI